MNNATAKNFCVMTSGRSGSTGLTNVLQGFPDIAVPGKQIDCPDNELVHPKNINKNLAEYSRISGHELNDADGLIEAFYEVNAGSLFSGFKTMPHRHPDFEKFTNRDDITFITLIRMDVYSTIVSFRMAWEKIPGCERRKDSNIHGL